MQVYTPSFLYDLEFFIKNNWNFLRYRNKIVSLKQCGDITNTLLNNYNSNEKKDR